MREIAVLLREVRDPRPPARLEGGAEVRESGLRRLVNPADLAALEMAVRVAERSGAQVAALAVGDEQLDDCLRLALSAGATRAIRVWDDAMRGGDAVAGAAVLHRVLEILQPALFFTGYRLLDRGDDPVAALAAANHGMPCVNAALSFELVEGRAEIVRKAEKGARQRLEATLPCAVLFDAGAAEPRYPALPEVLAAMEAPLEVWGIADLGLPPWELGFDGSALDRAGLAFPRSNPVRVATPDPSDPGHERVRALFSGGIRPRAGQMHFASTDETVSRILAIFAEEGLLPSSPLTEASLDRTR
jgi:electron transfer flavoprotein beta subunit